MAMDGGTTDSNGGVEVTAKDGRVVKLNGPIEVTWSHGEPYPKPNGAGFLCYYCFKTKKGGGVSRLREHLGGITGNVVECKNVPTHIKNIMADEFASGRIRRKRSTNLRLYVEKEVATERVSGRTSIPLDEEAQIERNWSTFALVHTKLRNRLSYDKLHKLVFVHYNLKLCIQHFVTDMQNLQEMQTNKEHERDSDPCSILIDVTMYDERNPIMDWLCTSRSESVPTLDERDDQRPESTNPSRLVIDELGMSDEEVAAFKKKIGGKRGKKRKEEFEDIFSDYESESDQQGSPVYAESGESSSDDSEGNGDGDAVHASGDANELGEGGSTTQEGAGKDKGIPLRPSSKRMKKRSVKTLY